jgi:hypothetical protein
MTSFLSGKGKEERKAILLSKIAFLSSFMTPLKCHPEQSEGSPRVSDPSSV